MIRLDSDVMLGFIWAAGIFGALAVALVWLSGCGLLAGRDPAAAVYGAERLACVERADAAAQARECMRAIDRKYAPLMPDGGR